MILINDRKSLIVKTFSYNNGIDQNTINKKNFRFFLNVFQYELYTYCMNIKCYDLSNLLVDHNVIKHFIDLRYFALFKNEDCLNPDVFIAIKENLKNSYFAMVPNIIEGYTIVMVYKGNQTQQSFIVNTCLYVLNNYSLFINFPLTYSKLIFYEYVITNTFKNVNDNFTNDFIKKCFLVGLDFKMIHDHITLHKLYDTSGTNDLIFSAIQYYIINVLGWKRH